MTTGQISEPAQVARRRTERALQAVAFDSLGARYSAAFPDKTGQRDCVDWLLSELPPEAKVLDVGCGTGEPTLRQLVDGGLRATAVDLSDGMLRLAREAVPEAELHRMDMYDLATPRAEEVWGVPHLGPAGAGTFDAATAFFSLILLPQAEISAVLGRIRELLCPGGLLTLAMVEADLDHAPLPFLGHELKISGYPREELAYTLARAGFTVERAIGHPYAPASTTLPPEEQLFLCCRRVDR